MERSKFQRIVLAEIERRDLSVAAAARLMQVPYDAVRDLKRRENYRPNHERASQMLQKLGLSINVSDSNERLEGPITPAPFAAHDPRGLTSPLGHNDMRVQAIGGQLIVHAAVDKRSVAALVRMIEASAEALVE